MNFVLIGILCGLAIYNFTIIYIPFPLVLYKKLLGEDVDHPVDLDDLDGISPSLAKGICFKIKFYKSQIYFFFLLGLKDLLAYQETDLEEVFCLNFTMTEDFFGEKRVVELKVTI